LAICKFCGKEKTGASSCIESFIIIDKKKYRPIPYKKPGRIFTKEQNQKRCPDCNIKPEEYHHVGCSIEICPRCNSRWIECRCQGVKMKIDDTKEKKCKIIQFKGIKQEENHVKFI